MTWPARSGRVQCGRIRLRVARISVDLLGHVVTVVWEALLQIGQSVGVGAAEWMKKSV